MPTEKSRMDNPFQKSVAERDKPVMSSLMPKKMTCKNFTGQLVGYFVHFITERSSHAIKTLLLVHPYFAVC
jgi:hypothetical protein